MVDKLELDELNESSILKEENVMNSSIAEDEQFVPSNSSDLEAIYDIPVKVSAILGKTNMKISQLMQLNKGTIIELDKKVGEAIDIYVNNNLVAKGEVVVVDDKLGITMTEVVKNISK